MGNLFSNQSADGNAANELGFLDFSALQKEINKSGLLAVVPRNNFQTLQIVYENEQILDLDKGYMEISARQTGHLEVKLDLFWTISDPKLERKSLVFSLAGCNQSIFDQLSVDVYNSDRELTAKVYSQFLESNASKELKIGFKQEDFKTLIEGKNRDEQNKIKQKLRKFCEKVYSPPPQPITTDETKSKADPKFDGSRIILRVGTIVKDSMFESSKMNFGDPRQVTLGSTVKASLTFFAEINTLPSLHNNQKKNVILLLRQVNDLLNDITGNASAIDKDAAFFKNYNLTMSEKSRQQALNILQRIGGSQSQGSGDSTAASRLSSVKTPVPETNPRNKVELVIRVQTDYERFEELDVECNHHQVQEFRKVRLNRKNDTTGSFDDPKENKDWHSWLMCNTKDQNSSGHFSFYYNSKYLSGFPEGPNQEMLPNSTKYSFLLTKLPPGYTRTGKGPAMKYALTLKVKVPVTNKNAEQLNTNEFPAEKILQGRKYEFVYLIDGSDQLRSKSDKALQFVIEHINKVKNATGLIGYVHGSAITFCNFGGQDAQSPPDSPRGEEMHPSGFSPRETAQKGHSISKPTSVPVSEIKSKASMTILREWFKSIPFQNLAKFDDVLKTLDAKLDKTVKTQNIRERPDERQYFLIGSSSVSGEKTLSNILSSLSKENTITLKVPDPSGKTEIKFKRVFNYLAISTHISEDTAKLPRSGGGLSAKIAPDFTLSQIKEVVNFFNRHIGMVFNRFFDIKIDRRMEVAYMDPLGKELHNPHDKEFTLRLLISRIRGLDGANDGMMTVTQNENDQDQRLKISMSFQPSVASEDSQTVQHLEFYHDFASDKIQENPIHSKIIAQKICRYLTTLVTPQLLDNSEADEFGAQLIDENAQPEAQLDPDQQAIALCGKQSPFCSNEYASLLIQRATMNIKEDIEHIACNLQVISSFSNLVAFSLDENHAEKAEKLLKDVSAELRRLASQNVTDETVINNNIMAIVRASIKQLDSTAPVTEADTFINPTLVEEKLFQKLNDLRQDGVWQEDDKKKILELLEGRIKPDGTVLLDEGVITTHIGFLNEKLLQRKNEKKEIFHKLMEKYLLNWAVIELYEYDLPNIDKTKKAEAVEKALKEIDIIGRRLSKFLKPDKYLPRLGPDSGVNKSYSDYFDIKNNAMFQKPLVWNQCTIDFNPEQIQSNPMFMDYYKHAFVLLQDILTAKEDTLHKIFKALPLVPESMPPLDHSKQVAGQPARQLPVYSTGECIEYLLNTFAFFEVYQNDEAMRDPMKNSITKWLEGCYQKLKATIQQRFGDAEQDYLIQLMFCMCRLRKQRFDRHICLKWGRNDNKPLFLRSSNIKDQLWAAGFDGDQILAICDALLMFCILLTHFHISPETDMEEMIFRVPEEGTEINQKDGFTHKELQRILDYFCAEDNLRSGGFSPLDTTDYVSPDDNPIPMPKQMFTFSARLDMVKAKPYLRWDVLETYAAYQARLRQYINMVGKNNVLKDLKRDPKLFQSDDAGSEEPLKIDSFQEWRSNTTETAYDSVEGWKRSQSTA